MGFRQVKQALDGMKKIQEKQMAEFDTGLLPGLEEQMAERKKGLARIQETMAELQLAIKKDQAMIHDPGVTEVLSQIRHLMHQNETLATRVRTHKSGLEQSMKRIKNGRQAIHAYGSGSFPKPSKVINFRN